MQRAQRLAPLTWRRFNTTLANNEPVKVRPIMRKPRDAAESRVGFDGGPHSVKLQFWHSPRHSADVLATIQYMESLCGPIEEFFCGKTYANRRSNIMFVRFRDYDSASRAKQFSASHIQIPAPQTPNEDPLEGGMSLKTFQSFLDVQPLQPDLKPVSQKVDSSFRFRSDIEREFLYVKVQEAYDVRHAPAREGEYLSRQAMRRFVRWAGFAPLDPLPPNTPLLEQGNKVDHPLMRHAVRRYAEMFLDNMPNPLEEGAAPVDRTKSWTRDPKTKSTASSSDTTKLASESISDMEEQRTVESIEADSMVVIEETPVEDSVSVAETAATPAGSTEVSPLPPSATPIPTSETKPTTLPSPAAVNSPKAQAQLRAANSILKKINKPKKTVAQAKVPSSISDQSKPQQKPQKPKIAAAPAVEKSPDSPLPPPPPVQEVEQRSQSESQRTSKLRGFMGKWF